MIFTYNILTGLCYEGNEDIPVLPILNVIPNMSFSDTWKLYISTRTLLINSRDNPTIPIRQLITLNGKPCDYPIIYATRIPQGRYNARKLMTISDEAGHWITPEQQKENEIIKLLNK